MVLAALDSSNLHITYAEYDDLMAALISIMSGITAATKQVKANAIMKKDKFYAEARAGSVKAADKTDLALVPAVLPGLIHTLPGTLAKTAAHPILEDRGGHIARNIDVERGANDRSEGGRGGGVNSRSDRGGDRGGDRGDRGDRGDDRGGQGGDRGGGCRDEKIWLTQNHCVTARVITDPSAATDDGRLYYIEAIDNFLMIFGSLTLYGNLGNIAVNERPPTRIKECIYGSPCPKIGTSCQYYHDGLIALKKIGPGPTPWPTSLGPCPHESAQSRQNIISKGGPYVRNFPASSWVFGKKDGGASRRIGSKSSLDADISKITADEYKKFVHQTMHDLLYCMIIAPYFASARPNDYTLDSH